MTAFAPPIKQSFLDKALQGFSVWVLPLAIGLFSLWTLTFWPAEYPEASSLALPIRVAVETDGPWDLSRAKEALEKSVDVRYHDTQMSEQPLWFSFSVTNPERETNLTVEFPSRHMTLIQCWDAGSQKLLGTATRAFTDGAFRMVRRGFGLNIKGNDPYLALICRTSFVGPARLDVQQWESDKLKSAVHEFDRNAGLLDGGLIVLAAFVMITALINRSPTYVLFAVWLVINLRMGALSAGWDTQWLGHSIPPDPLLRLRLITVGLQYVVTITLFSSLFKQSLPLVGYTGFLKAVQWTCIPLMAASLFLGYPTFLPLVWIASAFSSSVLVFLLGRILLRTRSPVAAWYAASLAIMLSASLYEVLAAALGFKSWIGSVNSVTAALSSSLLASLAIAVQMREDHTKRLQAQSRLQQTYEVIPIGLFSVNRDGEFLSANPALQLALGPAIAAAGSNRWEQYFGPDSWLRLMHMLNAQASAEMEVEGSRENRTIRDRKYLIKASLADERIEGSLEDITERSRVTAHLQFLAHHDALTKALNRTGIHEVLEDAAWNARPGATLALAYLDLDRFKLINHLYGHAAGDEVLRQVSARVSQLLSGEMRMGRMGGDEFLLTMPNTRIAHATLLCQGILNSISSRPYKIGDRSFHVRGSIGLIEVVPGTETKDAISTADRACREAKSSHGNHLVVFEKDSRIFQEHEEEMRLVEHLSATSDSPQGLHLEMQPIMSLLDPFGSLNFEVLLRMKDPDGHPVPTPRLISAAEFSGRMGVIDRWVLKQSLSWIDTHRDMLKKTQFVCINLSGASLNDERFVMEVYQLLENHADIAGAICLEITESVALHDLDNTRRFVDRVRGLGAKVALDDFGAGYTSFSYLRDLPADLLKIDGNFIVNMNQHPANVAIVEAIVNLARNLGMKTIAEWAEDMGTVQTLTEIGVDYVQGFIISRSREPQLMLESESSAAFIQDETLQQWLTFQASEAARIHTVNAARPT